MHRVVGFMMVVFIYQWHGCHDIFKLCRVLLYNALQDEVYCSVIKYSRTSMRCM